MTSSVYDLVGDIYIEGEQIYSLNRIISEGFFRGTIIRVHIYRKINEEELAMTEKYKCVLSLKVAKELISKGFHVVDVEPSRRYSGKVVFIFENTLELSSELAKFNRSIRTS